MIVALFWIPLVLIGAAAIAAFLAVRLSSVRIARDGVEIHNAWQTPTAVPLDEVVRFEEAERVGTFSFLRPNTGVLVLEDGTRLAVRALSDPEAGRGVDALNARVETLRRAA